MANINKNVLVDALKRYHNHMYTPNVYEHSIIGQAALLLEKSEEVVRCKDCKYFTDHWVTRTWCNWWGIDPDEGDFCSQGERREGE